MLANAASLHMDSCSFSYSNPCCPAATLLPPARTATCPPGLKGFVAVKDSQDGYSFIYPFGWQVRKEQQLGPPWVGLFQR